MEFVFGNNGVFNGGADFGSILNWPTINLPTLPTIDFPSIPQIDLPPMPSINLPPIPPISLPPIPTIDFPSIPSISLPPINLPPINLPPIPPISLPPIPPITIPGDFGGGLNYIIGDNQTISGNGILIAQGSGNQIDGLAGDNFLVVNGENIIARGNDGNDILIGAGGSNVRLVGGVGSDIFGLNVDSGYSIIEDFQDGQDKLRLPQLPTFSDSRTIVITDFATLFFSDNIEFGDPDQIDSRPVSFGELAILQQGASTEIRFGDDTLAMLTGIQVSQLTAEDFVTSESIASSF